ncbi:MAG: hypothetical protein R3F38_10240 [Gammaproteobacteria bacterium]
MLFMVLGYGLLLRPQAPTTPAPVAHSAATEPALTADDARLHRNLIAPAALPPPQHENDDLPADEAPVTTADSDADQRAMAQQQLDYLQQMVPETLMLPRDKTDPELEQMLAELELHRELQQRIDDNTASDEDRLRHYQLRNRGTRKSAAGHLRRAGRYLTGGGNRASRLADAHMAQSAPQRREAIEQSLLELEDLLYAHHE